MMAFSSTTVSYESGMNFRGLVESHSHWMLLSKVSSHQTLFHRAGKLRFPWDGFLSFSPLPLQKAQENLFSAQ